MRFKVPVTIEEHYTLYIEADDWEAAEDMANAALAKQSIQQLVLSSNAHDDPKTDRRFLLALPDGVEGAIFEDTRDVGPVVGQAEEDE